MSFRNFGDVDMGARGRAAAAHFAKKAKGCVVCGGLALRRVGASGYCGKHINAAERHQKALESNKASIARKKNFTGWE